MNNIFKALNDETRRKIIELLKEKEMNAGEIADKFNISKPSISHHLDILKRADLITSKKRTVYRICFKYNNIRRFTYLDINFKKIKKQHKTN